MATHFDYLCIGGGSGGIASANRAAMYGAKVALIEAQDLGGCAELGQRACKVGERDGDNFLAGA